jgi:hypothetical protein
MSCVVTQASTAVFYRSAKMVLTLALLAYLFLLTDLIRERADDRRRVPRSKLAGLFLLGLIMSVADRQGFFYLVFVTTIVGLLLTKQSMRVARVPRADLSILVASLCTIGAAVLHNNGLAPRIIFATNGYLAGQQYTRDFVNPPPSWIRVRPDSAIVGASDSTDGLSEQS